MRNPEYPNHAGFRFLASTPVRSFVLTPIVVVAFEISWRGGTLAFESWGLPLLAWGYLQYRLAGRFRTVHGGGGPGVDVPPTRVVTEGIYGFTRNPMYLGHIIFFVGLAVTFRSIFALALLAANAVWFHRRVLADEAQLTALFGPEYRGYMLRVKRWIPGLG
jgi:protein-S-isoprenylcysteine O-methyltransferase Ste14